MSLITHCALRDQSITRFHYSVLLRCLIKQKRKNCTKIEFLSEYLQRQSTRASGKNTITYKRQQPIKIDPVNNLGWVPRLGITHTHNSEETLILVRLILAHIICSHSVPIRHPQPKKHIHMLVFPPHFLYFVHTHSKKRYPVIHRVGWADVLQTCCLCTLKRTFTSLYSIIHVMKTYLSLKARQIPTMTPCNPAYFHTN